MKRKVTAWLAVTLAVTVGSARGNDEQIGKQIVERLQQQRHAAQMDGFNIGVQVEGGTVTMSGSVAQPEHAMAALDVARRVPGVKLVVNDLYVQPASGSLASPGQVAQASANTVAQPTKSTFVTSNIQPTNFQMNAPATASVPGQVSGTVAGFVPPTSAPIGSGTAPAAAASNAPQPMAFARSQIGKAQQAAYHPAPEYHGMSGPVAGGQGGPVPMSMSAMGGGAVAQASYDNPQMPGYAWPSYAAYPNYAAVSYPQQYSPTAWPYIGPFYPYPQVPLGWRKVTLEWDDGWWFLDFKCK